MQLTGRFLGTILTIFKQILSYYVMIYIVTFLEHLIEFFLNDLMFDLNNDSFRFQLKNDSK